MRRGPGKDEAPDKVMGPLFPRLHVNDTVKGGPRAPPRNKMALYEQFSASSHRFSAAASGPAPAPSWQPHRPTVAADIAAEEASVGAPFGEGRVRRVAVGQDGDGAFLGRRWAEFADACGVDLGWLVVLRHHCGGLLTVKAFDASCCLREFATRPPVPAVEEPMSSTDASRRPQFISVLARNSKQNLPMPAKFVKVTSLRGT